MAYFPLPPNAYIQNGRLYIPGLVGNIPTGNLKVRVKATADCPAGSILPTNAPFTQNTATGSAAVTPPAPVFVSYSDTSNTFTFRAPTGYSFLDCDYILNGIGPTSCNSTTINVGSGEVAINGLEVFVREQLPVRNQGARLLSHLIYTADSNNGGNGVITPELPTGIKDDVANTLTIYHPLGISELLLSTNSGAYVELTASVINVGNINTPVGYYKVKVKAAPGRNESSVYNSPSFSATLTQVAAPTYLADDLANTLAFYSPLGDSEIEVNVNNGSFNPYAGVILVGNIDRPAGYYKARIRALFGRAGSNVVSAPAFYATGVVTPAPPTFTFSDSTNFLDFDSPLGKTEILVSINSAGFQAYAGPYNVGEVDLPAGYYQAKIKAATGRNESAVTSSPIFTAALPAGIVPTFADYDDVLNTVRLVDTNAVLLVEYLYQIDNDPYKPLSSTGIINVGNITARVQAYLPAKPGIRGASPIAQSNLFTTAATTANTTPDSPSIVNDDVANTVRASSSYGDSEILVSANDAAFVPYTGIISVGDVNRPQGYWKFKVRAAFGRNESSLSYSSAFTIGIVNTTPSAPELTASDVNNTLSAYSPLGDSQILVSINNGTYQTYTGVITVGDVDVPIGYWKFKIKAAVGRNESIVSASPAFTVSVVAPVVTTPAAPGVTADDAANTLSFTHALGTSEIVVSINGAGYIAYSGPYQVGDVALAAGYYLAKIKLATNRNESAVTSSPAFTVAVITAPTFNTALDPMGNVSTVSYNGAVGTKFLFNTPLSTNPDPNPATMLLFYPAGTQVGQVSYSGYDNGTQCALLIGGVQRLTTFTNGSVTLA